MSLGRVVEPLKHIAVKRRDHCAAKRKRRNRETWLFIQRAAGERHYRHLAEARFSKSAMKDVYKRQAEFRYWLLGLLGSGNLSSHFSSEVVSLLLDTFANDEEVEGSAGGSLALQQLADGDLVVLHEGLDVYKRQVEPLPASP